MKKSHPRLVWSALAAALVLGALWQFVPLTDASARLRSLPETSAGVESRDFPLEAGEKEFFSRVQVLKRQAVVDGQGVILTAVDGTRDRHAIHDPRFCFQGAGWTITSQEPVTLVKGEATHVKLEKAGESTEAVFWFTDGVRQFCSPTTYWARTTLRRLTFGHSGDEPILVILSSGGGPPPDWSRLLKAWGPLQDL